jgi:hypothetical protein
MSTLDVEVATTLAALRDRKRLIDEMDTQLSEMITEVECALRAHVNLRIDVDLAPDVAEDHEALVFGKTSGQWRLMIVNEAGETPLTSCPRERRAEMFAQRKIHQLLANAVHQIDAHIEYRQTALRESAALLSALKGKVS